MPDSKIVRYEHHENEVAVRKNLKGKHRQYCLCFTCGNFNMKDPEKKCKIADELYQFCVKHGLTTPVWECPYYI